MATLNPPQPQQPRPTRTGLFYAPKEVNPNPSTRRHHSTQAAAEASRTSHASPDPSRTQDAAADETQRVNGEGVTPTNGRKNQPKEKPQEPKKPKGR